MAAPFTVTLPDDDAPKSDCCIDDVFGAFLENDAHWGSQVVPFVLHLLGCPMQESESLACDDLLSSKKLLAEVTHCKYNPREIVRQIVIYQIICPIELCELPCLVARWTSHFVCLFVRKYLFI
jgi:hypothetical protein